jgi:RND family efflux transporter MFP subunit
MYEKKKIFFVLISIIVFFLILVFITASRQKRRMARIQGESVLVKEKEIEAEIVEEEPVKKEIPFVLSTQEETLKQRLEKKEDFLKRLSDTASESEEEIKAKAKTILEKIKQQQEEQLSAEEPIAGRVFKARKVKYEDALSVTGDIKSLKEIKMRFEKEGVIQRIYVKEGDILKQGELIAVINKKDSLLAVARAQSKYDSDKAALGAAEKEEELTRILYDKGAIVETKLEEVKLRVESERGKSRVSEEELKMAKSALEKTELRAPIDGVIGARDAEEGEFFTPRDIVVNLLGIKELYAEVGIVERDINRISQGQKAGIKVDAYPNKEFSGSVRNLYPVVEGRSRTMKAEVDIVDEGGILLPGMFAQVEIFLAKFEEALMVPTMSLLQITPDVIVVPRVKLAEGLDEDAIGKGEGRGKIELIEVKVGYTGPDYARVIAGIGESDLVVLEAHGEIENGRGIRILGMEEYGLYE